MAAETVHDAAAELVAGGRARVEASQGPADDGQALLSRGGGDVAGLEAHGRAKEDGERAGDVGDDALRFGDLPLPIGTALIDAETVVVEGMIPDRVLFSDHAAEEGGMFFCKAADDEKGCANVVGGEDVENLWGELRMRAVVEGEGHGVSWGE